VNSLDYNIHLKGRGRRRRRKGEKGERNIHFK
jgi:hypothetical protein